MRNNGNSKDIRGVVAYGSERKIHRKISVCAISFMAMFTLMLTCFPVSADYDPGWGVAVLLEHFDDYDVFPVPRLAMNSDGNAIVVWEQSDGMAQSIYANRYTVGVGWGTPTRIEYNDYGASEPDVAINSNGVAVAVWQQNDGSDISIYANHYKPGIGWGDALLIETDTTGDNVGPKVAISDNGDAIAIWRQQGGAFDNVTASNYTEAGGWSPEQVVEVDDTGHAFNGWVEMDESGNGVAIWRQWDGSCYSIYSRNFTAGAGWDPLPVNSIEDHDMSIDAQPEMDMDGNGNVIVVWREWVNPYYNISWNRLIAGTGWGTAEVLVDGSTNTAIDPRISMNDEGKAMVVYKQFVSGRYSLYATRYKGGTWDPPAVVENNEIASVGGADVTMDNLGNAIAVWRHYDGFRFNLYANRYTPGSGWGTETLLETDNSGDINYPEVDSDGEGNAIAIWNQGDGIRENLWANRYQPYDNTPPGLSIETPADGTVTENSTIRVSGETEPGVELIINGIVVDVDANGDFEFQLALIEGPNLIEATATDEAGNPKTKSVTVTYENPVHELEDIKEELEETKNKLNDTKDLLNNTQNQLNTTKKDLDTTWNQLNDTEDELADTQAELDTTKTDLETTKTDLTTSQTDLTAIQTELDETKDDLEKAKDDIAAQTMMMVMLPIIVLVVLLVILFVMFSNLKSKIGKGGPPRSDEEIPYERPPEAQKPPTPAEQPPPIEDMEKPGPVPDEELPPPED